MRVFRLSEALIKNSMESSFQKSVPCLPAMMFLSTACMLMYRLSASAANWKANEPSSAGSFDGVGPVLTVVLGMSFQSERSPSTEIFSVNGMKTTSPGVPVGIAAFASTVLVGAGAVWPVGLANSQTENRTARRIRTPIPMNSRTLFLIGLPFPF